MLSTPTINDVEEICEFLVCVQSTDSTMLTELRNWFDKIACNEFMTVNLQERCIASAAARVIEKIIADEESVTIVGDTILPWEVFLSMQIGEGYPVDVDIIEQDLIVEYQKIVCAFDKLYD